MSSNFGFPKASPPAGADSNAYRIDEWIKMAVEGASNKAQLQRQLDSISTNETLVCFLHRFVMFNDALAARVPFLAGLIHLTPNLFVEPEGAVEFCRQANGRIAAFVAEAASDEYRMSGGRNMVHQYLSQRFFSGMLAHYKIDRSTFDRLHPFPPILMQLLDEARNKFFDQRGPEPIFSGLGFHVGLEFFAHQEFNLVDSYLRSSHPGLVAQLERDDADSPSYLWLTLHTVVEIGHYQAGMQALHASLKYYHDRTAAPEMVFRIKAGFIAFIDLQRRYYEAILGNLD